jgi:CheY-like chemotaxis protein
MSEMVLLIDDDPRLVTVLQIRLEASGYTVHAEFGGPEGLAAAKRLKPNVIVLDVNMPVMDGLQVCRLIREDGELSHTPIIVMSAVAHDAAKRDAVTAGASQFIAKPYQSAQIMAAIRDVVDGERAGATKDRVISMRPPEEMA